jgi:hypothetical protein
MHLMWFMQVRHIVASMHRDSAQDRADPIAASERALQKIERLLTTLHPPSFARLLGLALIQHMKSVDRYIGFVAVLFPKQPLIDLGCAQGSSGRSREPRAR